MVLGFRFFVSDIISGVLLGHLAHFIWPLAETTRWQYFAQVFSEN